MPEDQPPREVDGRAVDDQTPRVAIARVGISGLLDHGIEENCSLLSTYLKIRSCEAPAREAISRVVAS
jgi:hypothetical protein